MVNEFGFDCFRGLSCRLVVLSLSCALARSFFVCLSVSLYLMLIEQVNERVNGMVSAKIGDVVLVVKMLMRAMSATRWRVTLAVRLLLLLVFAAAIVVVIAALAVGDAEIAVSVMVLMVVIVLMVVVVMRSGRLDQMVLMEAGIRRRRGVQILTP